MISDTEAQTVTLRLLDGSIHTSGARPPATTRPTSSPTTSTWTCARRSPGPDARGGRPEGDDPRRSCAPPIAAQAGRRSRRARPSWSSTPQVRDPVRVHRLRSGRRPARHRSRRAAVRVARLRGQPRRDLHLLHPALGRAGLRRAGHRARRRRALAAQRRLRRARRRTCFAQAARERAWCARAARASSSRALRDRLAVRLARRSRRDDRPPAPPPAGRSAATSCASSCARSRSPCWPSSPSTCSPTSSIASTASSSTTRRSAPSCALLPLQDAAHHDAGDAGRRAGRRARSGSGSWRGRTSSSPCAPAASASGRSLTPLVARRRRRSASAMFAWNETVVPASARRWHQV